MTWIGAAAPYGQRRLAGLDRHLTEAAGDLFAHDDRLRGIAVDVRFDGGVAHLTGDVSDNKDLLLVRRLIGRLDGVLAVWSRVRVGGRDPVVLDIGCGGVKQYPGNVGVDLLPASGVDVLADLAYGLPFADRSVDVIFAVHVLEHLIDFLALIDECHRVLRPDGVLHVLSPWWRHVNAVADPTHVRLLDLQTIKGICRRPGSPLRWYPLHAGCDGASVFADLTPLGEHDHGPDDAHLARFFD
ncbi:methyltransferase domain-containing protein [Planosporangium thailandense]|uniref:Methyltransferase domain-containing protein n=1 Tax=Planosporangium thailandense TaxID=765197 RepID=A0ABX0XZW7_9ACTN|nr:methyltransferase domain-containing protein [Planosporangium thailandense]NJC70779.1 methyltransferase domain-containing protein [Planosporangium thailandense]